MDELKRLFVRPLGSSKPRHYSGSSPAVYALFYKILFFSELHYS